MSKSVLSGNYQVYFQVNPIHMNYVNKLVYTLKLNQHNQIKASTSDGINIYFKKKIWFIFLLN